MAINGQPTISDAVPAFGVCAKTINEYIKKGWIDQPPSIMYGTREIRVFSDEYIDKSKKKLEERRIEKRKNNGK